MLQLACLLQAVNQASQQVAVRFPLTLERIVDLPATWHMCLCSAVILERIAHMGHVNAEQCDPLGHKDARKAFAVASQHLD